jgi:hypothetical protein
MRKVHAGRALLLLVFASVTHAELPPVSELTRELERGEHPGIESLILETKSQIVGRYVAPKLRTAPPDLRSATKSIGALPCRGVAAEIPGCAGARSVQGDDHHRGPADDAQWVGL